MKIEDLIAMLVDQVTLAKKTLPGIGTIDRGMWTEGYVRAAVNAELGLMAQYCAAASPHNLAELLAHVRWLHEQLENVQQQAGKEAMQIQAIIANLHEMLDSPEIEFQVDEANPRHIEVRIRDLIRRLRNA